MRTMENKRRNIFLRMRSTVESAGLAATATFASILWVGIALPGLPLVPGLGGGGDRNLAISLDSALLGVQDKSGRVDASGRQARLAALLLPARNQLVDGLAAARQAQDLALSNTPVVVTMPAAPAPRPAPPAPNAPTELASSPLQPPPSPTPPSPPAQPASPPSRPDPV